MIKKHRTLVGRVSKLENNLKKFRSKKCYESRGEANLKKWAAEHMIDRLEELEGVTIDFDDLAYELTERENIDNGVFYNDSEAWEFIEANRSGAGDVLDYMLKDMGSGMANPFYEPDSFCVMMLIHYCQEVLNECSSIPSGSEELTRDIIDSITEELESF